MKKLISLILISCFLLTIPAFATEYRLAPSDQLEIKIINQKNLDTKQAIAPDGSISLPLVCRVEVQGKTLDELDQLLKSEYAKYIQKPQIVVYLTARPIYIVQHDLKKNTWEVKEAKSIEEARALVGKNYSGEIKYGDTIVVNVGNKPDFWEDNWYKVLTATAVAVGIYATLNK